jgi:flagellin
MRINTNVAALQAQQNLSRTNAAAQSSMAKLSSGFRIVKAGDDAAGLSIANNLRTNVRSLTQASRNIDQAQSVLSIAEGAASSIEKILERMKELAVQASTDTNASQLATLNKEFGDLKLEIDRIANSTEFQGAKLIDGTFSGKTLQIGAGNTTNEQIALTLGKLDTTAEGLALADIDLTDKAKAQAAMTAIDGTAMSKVNAELSNIGAAAEPPRLRPGEPAHGDHQHVGRPRA